MGCCPAFIYSFELMKEGQAKLTDPPFCLLIFVLLQLTCEMIFKIKEPFEILINDHKKIYLYVSKVQSVFLLPN